MLGLVTALLSTPPPLDANNCTVLTTSPCVLGGVGSALGAERKASLSCLRRFADATSDSFGVLDNSIWQEYAPTCAVWDGVPFGVAEPLNAFSSLAFEELLCAAAWSGSPHSLFPRGAPGYSAWQWWLWAACTHSQGELSSGESHSWPRPEPPRFPQRCGQPLVRTHSAPAVNQCASERPSPQCPRGRLPRASSRAPRSQGRDWPNGRPATAVGSRASKPPLSRL